MRDLLRLLGIAILVFAIVGFAMIYSRDSAFRYGVASFLSGTSGAVSRGFSDLTGLGQGDEPRLTNTILHVARPMQTRWVGLSGFPDQTAVHFSVPQIGGYVDGRLELRFDVQLAQGGDGLLSIAVNGERRSEIVLNTGHNTYDVDIPLTPADLLTESVVVDLSARGTTNAGQICPTESSNAGSAINVLPESALVLTTMQEADDPQTALIEARDPLMIYLGEDTHSQAVAMWAAQHLARVGISATLVDDPATPGRIVVTDMVDQPEPVEFDLNGNIVLHGRAGLNRAITFHRAETLAREAASTWPISAAALTTETMVRTFRGSKRWTLPYRIADLPGGLTPTRLELALRASVLSEEYPWIVRISLNGNLLHTTRLPGDNPDIRLAVDLPTDLQRLSNSLVVELVDGSPSLNVCRPADAQAQLLPETRLTASGPQPVEGWGALVRQLATAPFVIPGNHGLLTVNQATRVAAALMQFLPSAATVAFEADGPAMTLTVMNKDRLAEILQSGAHLEPGRKLWAITAAVGPSSDALGLNDLTTVDPDLVLDQMRPTNVAIIVQSPPAQ